MFCFYFIIGYSQKRGVSFYARLTKKVALGTAQIIIFDEVVTNNGHAYNKQRGTLQHHVIGRTTSPPPLLMLERVHICK